jgi:hypothetical protein
MNHEQTIHSVHSLFINKLNKKSNKNDTTKGKWICLTETQHCLNLSIRWIEMPLNLLQRKVISYHYHRDWMTLQGQTLMGQKLPDNHDQTNVLVKDAKMIFQVNFFDVKTSHFL